MNIFKRKNNFKQAALIFMIPKKNGKVRFTSDFRYLNKRTKRKSFSVPQI